MTIKTTGLVIGALALGLMAFTGPASAETRTAIGQTTVGGAEQLLHKTTSYRHYRGYRSRGFRSGYGYRHYGYRPHRSRSYYGYRSYRPYYRGYRGGFRGHHRGFRFNRP